jgi:hypothetical protein
MTLPMILMIIFIELAEQLEEQKVLERLFFSYLNTSLDF